MPFRDTYHAEKPVSTGYTGMFWVRTSFISAVLDFLNGGVLPDEINQTTLALILKTRNPQEMKEYMPILLCNVIYKLCSKVLANRLLEFFDDIIAEE